MNLKEGTALYARIDYKVEDKNETEQDGMDSVEYLQRIAAERTLIAGIFGDMEIGNIDGAMILFEANDLEEAKKIAQGDPIIERGFYRCEVYKWNLMLSSDGVNKQ